MAASEILAFAQGPSPNVLSQAAYAADAMRTTGHQPGVGRSQLMNKQALQSSVIAAAVARFIADRQAVDITDQLAVAALAGYLQDAVYQAVVNKMTASGMQQFIANGGWQKLPGGLIVQWGGVMLPISGAAKATQAFTYPIAFPTGGLAWTAAPIESGHTGDHWPSVGVQGGTATGATAVGYLAVATFNKTCSLTYTALGY